MQPASSAFQHNFLTVRFEVFTAVTMKNAVFWDIKAQLVPHRRLSRGSYKSHTA
jgi:hypothetical protein